jgi:putative N-acetyltransferase (TIGR04045 family)
MTALPPDIVAALGAPPAARPDSAADQHPTGSPWIIVSVDVGDPRCGRYAELRRGEFAQRQGLFVGSDRDATDVDPETRVLIALGRDGGVLGGVRVHPDHAGAEAIGWWRGSRLVVEAATGARRGQIGAALVTAACAQAFDAGALRFDAHVQTPVVPFFTRLGWRAGRELTVAGRPHRLMHYELDRFVALASETKAPLGGLIGDLLPDDRWRGDDGVPVPGSDVVACTDAIVPAMVARDPEWAGWCGMLVTAHDLSAMGARFVGALDALAAPDAAHAQRVIAGIRAGADALGLPVIGGHTSLGAPAALAVTGLGTTADPVAAGDGRVGDVVRLTADVHGDWRPGYRGRQWDSTSSRTREQLIPMLSAVARSRPRAAKDVSMAGVVGTLGMLAEAAGCGAELEVSAVPRPATAAIADWLTCFPGFAMLSTDAPGRPPLDAGEAVSAACGSLVAGSGVALRWPDGELSTVLTGAVSGLGAATIDEPGQRR